MDVSIGQRQKYPIIRRNSMQYGKYYRIDIILNNNYRRYYANVSG